MGKPKNLGQALVEYLFVLLFCVLMVVKMVDVFTDFFRDSVGNLGHVLSIDLSVGICSENCFYTGYENGSNP